MIKPLYIAFGCFLLIIIIAIWYVLALSMTDIPSDYWLDFSFLVLINNETQGQYFKKPASISFFILMLLPIFYGLMKYQYHLKHIYGDARFATRPEIKKYGYNAKEGIIIGQRPITNELIISHGPKTVGLSAKPRSGKGVSLVIPNLLTWDGSVVCVDIKKELFEITSGYRAEMGQKIVVFDPMDEENKSHSINIFDDVSKDPLRRIADVQRIAKTIIPTKDPFWDAGGRSIFIGVCLYLFETDQHVSFGSIYRFVNGKENLQEKFLAILEQQSDDLSAECIALLRNYGEEESEKVSGGFLGTFNTRMEPFSNPLICAATDHSDFDFSLLRKDKTTIYLVSRPEHISILGRIFGLITETIIFALTRHAPEKNEKGKVLFMFDEFTALGPMDRVKKGSAYFGGYGIRLVMIYQNEAQLQDTYTPVGARELASLMHERIVFAPSDITEARNISAELGNMTVKTENRSYNQGRVSKSISKMAKPLMNPENVLRLPNHQQLILCAEQRPIKCNKIFYYKDKRFTKKLLPPYSQLVPKLIFKDYQFNEIDMSDDFTKPGDSKGETLQDMAF